MPPQARQRQRTVPNQQPYIPASVDIGSTVSVTGSIVSNPTTSASFSTSQVTITASATPIFAINTRVLFREVMNPTSSNATVFIGVSTVTVTTGHYLPGGTAFDQANNSAALFGIVTTGSVTVSTIGW